MQLTRIFIEKFRAIRRAEIIVDRHLALVGQNSAGKSSVLRALNAFFNFDSEAGAFAQNQHSFFPTAFAVIDLTFAEVPASCTVPRTIPNGSEIRARLRYRKQAQWQVYVEGHWQQIPADELHANLSPHITYALVPTRRDHEVAGWSADGLMNAVIEQAVSGSKQRDNISPRIKDLSEKVLDKTLQSLARRLRQNTPMRGKFDYSITRSNQLDYRILLSNLELRISEGSQSVALADAGSGNQSLAVFALYSYLAEQRSSTYILGLEEPEQNLHPQAQIQLMSELRASGLQVVFTTHSPTLIDALDHEQVALCRRVPSTTRNVEVEVRQLPIDFFATVGLDRDDYYRFHRRRNSDFFFADHVVVFESPIDSAVAGQLSVDGGVDLSLSGVTPLALDGVGSLPYVFHLLRTIGIASTYVVDRDYFLAYVNGDLASSRDPRGYPIYGSTLKKESVASFLFPKLSDRAVFERAIASDYARATELLGQVGFICFQWSLEVDLVRGPSTRSRLFIECHVPKSLQTESELLLNRSKKIKSQAVLVNAVRGLPGSKLPGSYKALRRRLLSLV